MSIQFKTKLEYPRSNLFWGSDHTGRKIPWIACNSVLALKSKGCLGIDRLEAFKFSFLEKWIWRCVHEQNALWVNLIVAIYGDVAGVQIFILGYIGIMYNPKL